jgi:hypothetical protein
MAKKNFSRFFMFFNVRNSTKSHTRFLFFPRFIFYGLNATHRAPSEPFYGLVHLFRASARKIGNRLEKIFAPVSLCLFRNKIFVCFFYRITQIYQNNVFVNFPETKFTKTYSFGPFQKLAF